MRDLVRAWFWGGLTLLVLLLLAGRMLTSAASVSVTPLVALMTMVSLATAFVGAVAHPAPARESLGRFVAAVLPLVLLPALTNLLSALSSGASLATVLGALAVMLPGGALGAVLGARAVTPRPRRGATYNPPTRPARRRGAVAYAGSQPVAETHPRRRATGQADPAQDDRTPMGRD